MAVNILFYPVFIRYPDHLSTVIMTKTQPGLIRFFLRFLVKYQ
ncbi:hypothetical protein CBFG_01202 [Clostridiales bacterium 1_7_47FAA]|nr:hypothetical protein CBFG_01202 [Clostridiales bacterium 1_7_47FAA]